MILHSFWDNLKTDSNMAEITYCIPVNYDSSSTM